NWWPPRPADWRYEYTHRAGLAEAVPAPGADRPARPGRRRHRWQHLGRCRRRPGRRTSLDLAQTVPAARLAAVATALSARRATRPVVRAARAAAAPPTQRAPAQAPPADVAGTIPRSRAGAARRRRLPRPRPAHPVVQPAVDRTAGHEAQARHRCR